MRRLASILFFASLPLILPSAAYADYTGVAGQYDDAPPPMSAPVTAVQKMPTPAPTPVMTSSLPGHSGVAGQYDDAPPAPVAMQRAPERANIPTGNLLAPIPLKAPAPEVTITPPPIATTSNSLSEKNFKFIPAGASQSLGTLHTTIAAPKPVPQQQTAAVPPQKPDIANNYPVNHYDGPMRTNPLTPKEYNPALQAPALPDLHHGQTFHGQQSNAAGGQRTIIIANNADWMTAWEKDIGARPPGHLASGQKAVIVYDAPHGYSGYDSQVNIAHEDDNSIDVQATHIAPAPNNAIAPMATQPYAVIVLDAGQRNVSIHEGKKLL